MARDRDFLDAMRGLGVRPLDGPPLERAPDAKRLERPRRRPPSGEAGAADSVGPEDKALFLEAMGELGLGDSPGKEAAEPARAEPAATAAAGSLAAVPATVGSGGAVPMSPTALGRRADPVTDADRALFLAGVERVGAVSDKDAAEQASGLRDRAPGTRPGRRGQPERAKPQRAAGTRSSPLPVDDRLDLHRERLEPALERLHAFLVQAAIAGHARVLVITGKGHHSEDGRGVLRRAVENWLIRHAGPWVARYAVAPRALGGRGAWIVELHRQDGSV